MASGMLLSKYIIWLKQSLMASGMLLSKYIYIVKAKSYGFRYAVKQADIL